MPQVEEAGDGLLLQYMFDLRAGMCMYEPSVRRGLVITHSVRGQTSKGTDCIMGTLQDVPCKNKKIPVKQPWIARIRD